MGFSGLERVKIKLNGGDGQADLDRILAIDRITTAVQDRRGLKQWSYCLDFNERCPNVQYLMEILREGEGGVAGGVRAHSLCGTAHAARFTCRSGERDA